MSSVPWSAFASVGATALLALLLWITRKWIEEVTSKRLDKVDTRLNAVDVSLTAIKTSLEKPNGGSSVRDALNRIESAQITMLSELAHLKGRFDNHIEEGK